MECFYGVHVHLCLLHVICPLCYWCFYVYGLSPAYAENSMNWFYCCADNIISKYLQFKLHRVENMMPTMKKKVYLPILRWGAMSSWAASIWKHCDSRNVTSSSTSVADWHMMTVLYWPWYPSRISVFTLDSLSYKHCFLKSASIYIYVCVCVCVYPSRICFHIGQFII